MAKFHITKRGEAAPCTATVKACPIGGEEIHGSTPEEARAKFEASQEAIPRGISKEQRNGFNPVLLEKVNKASKELQANTKARKKVEESIRSEINLLKAQAEVIQTKRQMAIAEVLSEATIDDLADPEKAKVLYDYGWDNGRGNGDFDALTRTFTKGTGLSLSDNWLDRDEDRNEKIAGFTFYSDNPIDSEGLAKAAALVEKIYPTQQALSPDAYIEVAGPDGDSLTIRKAPDEEQWRVSNRTFSSNVYNADNIQEALLYAQKRARNYIASLDEEDRYY